VVIFTAEAIPPPLYSPSNQLGDDCVLVIDDAQDRKILIGWRLREIQVIKDEV